MSPAFTHGGVGVTPLTHGVGETTRAPSPGIPPGIPPGVGKMSRSLSPAVAHGVGKVPEKQQTSPVHQKSQARFVGCIVLNDCCG